MMNNYNPPERQFTTLACVKQRGLRLSCEGEETAGEAEQQQKS